MQLVLSNNRVLAHGEDCFLAMGGTVICENSGRAYQNATVAETDIPLPADINEVGYEFHGDCFVPCAPYGKTTHGAVMLACQECGAPRSSGLVSDDGGLYIPGKLTGGQLPTDVTTALGLPEGSTIADALLALAERLSHIERKGPK